MPVIQDKIRERSKKVIMDKRKKMLDKFTNFITSPVITPDSLTSIITYTLTGSLFLYFLGVWLVVLLIGA